MRSSARTLVAAMLALFAAYHASAADRKLYLSDYRDKMVGVGFGTPRQIAGVGARGMAVALDGSRLLVGAGSRLYALDASDPLRPALVGELDGFGNLRQIRLCGDFVYVVSRETGLRIVDVSDPAHMRIRSRYDTVEFATGIDVAWPVAFLSERIYGVEAVDVRDPDRPVHIAIRRTDESQSCRYLGGWLFSGEWESGAVTIFDAHDMRAFREVAKLELGGFGDGVELDGGFLYCSTGHDSRHRGDGRPATAGDGHGLDVFDISDPVRPRHVSRVDFPVFAPRNDDFWTPRVANGWALCCDSHNGLFAVDVKDPAKPKIVDRLCIPDPKQPDWPSAAISSLEVGEGCLYVTCSPGGLFVVPMADVSPRPRGAAAAPENASFRDRYETDAVAFEVYRPDLPGQARAVAMRGDVAYAAFGDAGLHVVRIGRNGGIEKLGELPGRHRVTDCCFVGDRLLVAEGDDGFALYGLDGPVEFREIARRPASRGGVAFWCWAMDSKTVVLSGRDGTYSFHDVDDIKAQTPLARLCAGCQWDRYPADAAVDGRFPVLVPYKGLEWVKEEHGRAKVLPLCPPLSPERTGDQRNGVARFGDRFLCTVGDGYEILSADGKSNGWRRLGGGGFRGIPRTDVRHVLLTERSARRASVWDFKDVDRPVLLREYRFSGAPDAGAFFDGRAVIPVGYQGLAVERRAAE